MALKVDFTSVRVCIFARFQDGEVEYMASVAIIERDDRCGNEYVAINFSDPMNVQIQESIRINDSGQNCRENELQCFQKVGQPNCWRSR